MPTVTMKPYGNFPLKLANKEIDLDSDTLKATLHSSSYTPNLDTHDYLNDLTDELSTAGGYTSGGVTLATAAISYVAANSWARVAATSTAYTLGQVVRPSSGNGFIYRAAVAGTSGGSAPTWPTVVGTTVTDGGVTWTCEGRGALVFDADDVSWSTFTAGPFRYIVIHDHSPASDATRPLIALGDFGSDQTGGGSTFTTSWDASGILVAFVR